jgi:predicted nucleic acid-binding Zn ribbon protein
LFQKMSDEPRATCPKCGLESERLLSAGAGFLFKGDGFYVTDYRSDSYKKAASEESPSGTSGTGKGAGEAQAPKTDGAGSGSGGAATDAGGGSTSEGS